MTEAERNVWRFAVANPDYWPLFQEKQGSPEIRALPEDDREAFEAARAVATQRAISLLGAVWTELGKSAEGTVLYDWMANQPQHGTMLANKMRAWLPDRKGSLWFGLWTGKGSLSMWATLYTAKMRFSAARAAWGSGDATYEDRGVSVSVFVPIDAEADDDENARRLTAEYWPRLSAWLAIPSAKRDNESDEAK